VSVRTVKLPIGLSECSIQTTGRFIIKTAMPEWRAVVQDADGNIVAQAVGATSQESIDAANEQLLAAGLHVWIPDSRQ
jgi:hypothetical protein